MPRRLPSLLREGNHTMAIDIVGLIRGRRQTRAAGIEEVAKRLAGGEAVPPEEIETVLARAGCDEVMLQERVDALERRAELRKRVAAGEAAQRRLDLIDGEIDTAWQAAVAADEAQRKVRQKHEAERIALGQAIRYADTASDELLSPANLSPADRDRLTEQRRVATAAVEALAEANRRLPELRDSLARAEAALAEAADEAKRFKNPDAQERKARAETTVKTRGARLKAAEADLPSLQQAAEQAEQAVAKLEEELRAS